MKNRTNRWAELFCLVCLMFSASSASAQVGCHPNLTVEPLIFSDATIAQWENRQSASLSATAKALLETDICRAVSEIASQTGAPIKDIDAAAGPAIEAYLDDILSSRSQFPSLSARFEAAFLLNASAQLPEQRRTAIVTFRFTRAVDLLTVGSSRWGPVGRLVSEYGTFPYQGFRSGQRVCSGSFVVNSSIGATVLC